MLNLLRYVVLKPLRARPLRGLLTTTGVGLGVALYIAIEIINRSTLASYRESVQTVSGKTTLTITGDATGFAEEKIELARKVPGVSYAVPEIESRAHRTGAGEQDETLVVLGVDLLEEHSVWNSARPGGKIVENALSFLNHPDSIILTQAFADQHGLQKGSSIELATTLGQRKFVVRGILPPDGPSQAYGGGIAVMDIDAARLAFGKQGKIDRIDVVTEASGQITEEQGIDDVAARLRLAFGPAYHVERPEGLAENLKRTIRPFQLMLTLFSSLALLVGLFLVANSIGISVSERRSEMGTLRALGATRRMILSVFLFEAAVIGGTGSLLGTGVGRFFAQLLAGMVSQTISKQARIPIEVTSFRFSLTDFLAAIAIGTGVALLAALLPSLRAMHVQPLEAMGTSRGRDPVSPESVRWLPWVGATLLIYLQISSTLGLGAHYKPLALLDPVCGILGALCLGPALVVFMVRGLCASLRPRLTASHGTLTRLATEELLRNPKRTASNLMNLMVGLLLFMMLSTINTSFRDTLMNSFGNAVRPDLLASSSSDVSDDQAQPIAESVGRELAQVPGVSGTYAMRKIPITYQGRRATLKAFDETDPAIHYGIYEMRDRPASEAGEELYHSADNTIFVSETFSFIFHKKTGDSLDLMTPSGLVPMRIVGVEVAPAVSDGLISMSRAQYKKLWHDTLVNMFAVQLLPGADPAQVKGVIDRGVGHLRGLSILSQAGVKEQINHAIDRSFRATHAVEAAALLVGFLGLLNTLIVAMMERRQELGQLRAIGMSRRQLYGMILLEASILGVLGSIVALSIGTWISYLWITHSMAAELGWSVRFSLPWTSVLVTVALGIGVMLSASFWPARRAAHLEIREALGYE